MKLRDKIVTWPSAKRTRRHDRADFAVGPRLRVTTTATTNADLALVERIAKGDEAALRVLYNRFAPTLQAVTYRILQDRADSEEVVAESFAQVWREASRFSRKRGSVSAWLTMIARSRAIDAVRARRRRDQITDRASQVADTAPGLGTEAAETDSRAEANERRHYVQQALADLSDDQRQAIELAYFGGRSQSEIATQLNLPLGTVKTRIRSAMHILREKLRHLFADMTNE